MKSETEPELCLSITKGIRLRTFQSLHDGHCSEDYLLARPNAPRQGSTAASSSEGVFK